MRRESGVRQDEWQVVGRYWVGMMVGLGLAVVGLGVVRRMRRSGREVGVAGLIVGTRMVVVPLGSRCGSLREVVM